MIGWATETIKGLFGWDAGDIVGKGLDLLYAEEAGYLRTMESLECSASHRGLSQLECLCRKRDGADLLCSVWALKLSGHVRQWGDNLIIFRDITKERDAEHALRDSWYRYIHLADSLPHAMFEVDETGRLIFINRAGLAALGYTERDLQKGLNLFDLLAVEDRERATADLTRELSLETGRLYEYLVITKTGERLLVAAYPRRTINGGGPFQLRTLVFDVSERRRHEEALKGMKMKLEERDRTQQETTTALKTLVREWESHKKAYALSVSSTIKGTLLPLIEELKKSRIPAEVGGHLDILEAKLEDLTLPVFNSLATRYPSLSAKELRVADLIRDGKTTKEIARLFHVTPAGVDFHRNNIRRKLGLKNRKANLRSYLLSLNLS